MRGIMRKDAPMFALFAVPIIGLQCTYLVLRDMPHDFSDLLLMGFYVVLTGWGGIFMSESMEVGSGGYRFLETLPLTDREIVAGKFLVVSVTLAACVAALYGVVWASELGRRSMPLASLYLVSSAVAGLLFAGSAYAATYRWGFSRVSVPAWLAFPLLFVACILFIELVLQKGRLDLRGLASLSQWLIHGLSVTVALAGLAAYYGLMGLAIRARQRRRG